MVRERLVVMGAPTSAGAYGPGQERAPSALRAAGLFDCLHQRRIPCEDAGDVPGYRWHVDRLHPRARNGEQVARVARAVAGRVRAALDERAAVLVIGGDCTIELGTVAGALRQGEQLGLVYIDLDTDLNTPDSTDDGALDWMGVAHLLALDGTVPDLAALGPKTPMLGADQVLYFANDNSLPFERAVIEERKISEVPLAAVVTDPIGAARSVVEGWGARFDQLLVHVDLDVLNGDDMPLAENCRTRGLLFEQLVAAVKVLVAAPIWVGLTVAELNPDHGQEDGSTLRRFNESLADILACSPGLKL